MKKPRRCGTCREPITPDRVSPWSTYWCLTCDRERMARIDRQLAGLGVKVTEEAPARAGEGA